VSPLSETQIIEEFYRAFQRLDAEAMVSLYHNEIEFSDPVFRHVKGEDAKNMWRMLIKKSDGKLQIYFHDILGGDDKGVAQWEATYPFKPTGNIVHNKINATFEFKDGKIYRHDDCFGLLRWYTMAYGIQGFFMGIFPPARTKMRKVAMKQLKKFSAKATITVSDQVNPESK